jgi:transposase
VRTDRDVRTHRCSACGLMLDRDHNAVLLIRAAGVTRAIQQGDWDPANNRSMRAGPRSGIVGHTGT